jgi:hypothetical protein
VHFLAQLSWIDPPVQCGVEEARAHSLVLFLIFRGKLSDFQVSLMLAAAFSEII